MVVLPKINGAVSSVNWRSMRIFGRRARAPQLRQLVHKPTFACTAKCVGCENRRKLHRASKGNELLSFDQHLELYRQAAALGVSELHLSGGEPTLYKRLPELVAAGKGHGWFVMLNSNGSQLGGEDLVERLFAAGLDGVMLSLYSHRAQVHDTLRQQQGLWRRAVDGLGVLNRYRREQNQNFLIITQSILSRDNLFDAAELIRLVGENGSDVHLFSYLEGDFGARLVPTVEMLQRFRTETIPGIRRAVLSLPEVHPVLRGVAWWRAGRLFDNRRNADTNYAGCVYNETQADFARCNIPNEFMLVLPDGNVHPCNAVEYTHEPVVGNFLQSGLSLKAIWEGDAWQRFRRERHHWCRRCPMTYHNWIPLNATVGRLGRLLRGRLT